MGGLVGGIVYAGVFPSLKPYLVDPLSFGKITLPGLLSAKTGIPQSVLAYLIVGLFILGIVYLARVQNNDNTKGVSVKRSQAV